MIRYLDICAGISASTVAWKPLGWQATAYSEIEAAPRAILAHHYPDVPLHGDFTTIRGNEYGPTDLLVGGTPCQDFSVAGLRAGLDGGRGNLSLEFLRLADRARPRWLVWENVPGVLSIDGGRAFGAILGGLGELGYGFAYRVLDAQYFGVPQRRRRVFVVGYLGDHRRAAAVLFERHSLSGHPAPRRETGQGIADAAGGGPDGGRISGCISSKWAKGSSGPAGDEVANMVAQPITGPLAAGGSTTGGAPGTTADTANSMLVAGSGRGTPLVPVAFTQNSRSEVREIGGDGQIVGALAANVGAQQQSYVAYRNSGNCGAWETGQVTGALDTGTDPSSIAIGFMADESFTNVGMDVSPTLKITASGGGGIAATCIAAAVRRLTPRECERLQGFPDDYTLVPYRRGMMADGPRYKALGNSMAVPVMRWIGERIAAVEAMRLNSMAA